MLKNLINKIRKNSLSGEFYLTDIVKILSKENKNISFIEIDEEEIIGINTQLDLSIAEGISQNLIRNKAMMNGVKLIDPNKLLSPTMCKEKNRGFSKISIAKKKKIKYPYCCNNWLSW